MHVEVGPSDVAIRPALRSQLLVEHAHDPETVLIEELGLRRGLVRVDIAVVNGLLHGYEIKSDRDSLRRLVKQVDVYSAVLDRATVVVGDRHLASARTLVPTWWGVVHCRETIDGFRFRTVRRPRKNPNQDPRVLVELLWADHALRLLERRGIDRGVRGKPRRVLWDRICETFSVEEVAAAVRATLKARSEPRDPA
jgi:hypothetical protein